MAKKLIEGASVISSKKGGVLVGIFIFIAGFIVAVAFLKLGGWDWIRDSFLRILPLGLVSTPLNNSSIPEHTSNLIV